METSRQSIVEEYFEALDSGDFERAAKQFTPDVTYIHPPMYSDDTHITGRDTLYSFFTDVRGKQETEHHVERFVGDENSGAVVGYVTEAGETTPLEYFVAYAEFVDSEIEYYIAGLLGMK